MLIAEYISVMDQLGWRFQVAKDPIIQTPDYIIYEEILDGFVILHTDVFMWNKRVKEDFILNLNRITNHYGVVYTYHFKDDLKHKKFLELIGGKYYKEGDPYGERELEWWIKRRE